MRRRGQRPRLHSDAAMSRKNENIVRHSAAALQAMEREGRVGTDWRLAAEKPVPDGTDPDDAIEPIEGGTTLLPKAR